VESCEHSNEPASSFKLGEYIEWLNDYQILQKKICSMQEVVTLMAGLYHLSCCSSLWQP